MKGTPTSKKNLCPICGNHHGCKIQGNQLVLCLRSSSQQDAPPGYRFVKSLRNSMGGLFAVDNGDSSDTNWQDRIDRINARRQRKRDKTPRRLNIEERDRQYRSVISQVELLPQHAQILLERGLTLAEIEQAGFLSWEPGKRVSGATSQLAGINKKGDRLGGAKGIFLPAYDPDSHITGAQLKTDDSQLAKYLWLSSAREDGNGGNGPQLPNGELPLFCWKHPEAQQISSVILCEGGLKSAIAAHLLWRMGLTNIAIIGTAAGGFFGPQTLKDYLTRLAPQRIALAPDAGAVNNTSNIPVANWQTIKLCQSWGYNVDVLWWGQLHKNQHLDIDELLVDGRWNEAQTLTPDEFFQLHPESAREKIDNFTAQPAGASTQESEFKEPDPDLYLKYLVKEAEQQRTEDAAADFERERRKRGWQKHLERQLNPDPDSFVWGRDKQEAPDPQSLWKLGYTPSKTVHQRYLDLAGIHESFLCVVSRMNTGKTQALAKMVSDLAVSVLIVTNTISLAEALAVRYNCHCYNEPDLNLAQCDRLVITADSLWRVPTPNKRFKFMIIDEADQVTSHLTTGFTCKRNRERTLASFGYYAATAECYVLADADLSGTVIDWHSHLRTEKPFILKNTYQPTEGRTSYQISSQAATFEYGCQLLAEGKRVLFCCDSKTTVKKTGALLSGIDTIEGIENLAESLEAQLATRFPDKIGRVVHGDNSGNPEVRNFIKNINASLQYLPLDYLIYNSSIQSGVSIDFHAFDAVICLLTGYTLAHTELAQLIHRFRPEVPISFWINSKGRTGFETNCYNIAGNFIYKNQADGVSLRIDPNTGMIGIDNPEFLQLVASLEARRNWSLMNIEAAFKRHLEEMGYEIVPHPDEDLLTDLEGTKSELKERKRIVEAAEIATICKSELLTPQQYEPLKNKPNPTFNERCAMQHFELHQFYGIEVNESLLEKDDGGSLRQQLTLFELLLHPEAMARHRDLSDRQRHHVITDLKHYKLQCDLLSDLGLLEFIDPEKEYHSNDLIALGERASFRVREIKKILNITISVAPRYLKEGRILARKGIKAAFKPATSLGAKWLLSALANGSMTDFNGKEFDSQEQANEYCSQLSPVAKLICEAIAIEKRFRAKQTTHSQIHAILCEAVGLKREQVRQSKATGRFYQITADSWEFANAVFLRRQEQRKQRFLEREQQIEVEAKRFQHLDSEQLQTKIETEVEEVNHLDAPALVFLAECWIKYAPDFEKSDTRSHTPRNISIYDFSRWGVTKSQTVVPGQEVQLLPLAVSDLAAKPLAQQSVGGPLIIEQIATGRNGEYELHDYLKLKPEEAPSYWVPAEWLQSPDGLPVRHDPDAYSPRVPSSTLNTWRNWLLGVRSLVELEKFERQRRLRDLQSVVDSLASEQMETLQQRFQEWGIERGWLPVPPAATPAPESQPTAAESPVTPASEPPQPTVAESTAISDPANIPATGSTDTAADSANNGWLPAEVCILGQWFAGFWRHVVTEQWLTAHGTTPIIAPKEWRFT